MDKPKINFAFLCDQAFLSERNKLNIIGIFQEITLSDGPVIFPQIYVVVNLILEKDISHTHSVKLIRKKDKAVIIFINDIDFTPDKDEVTFLDQLALIKLDEPGEYGIEILVDGEIIKELPLRVIGN